MPTIQDSVQKLRYKFDDIKILLGSHAHGDHQEGNGLVVKLTGAKAMAMAEDIPLLQALRSPGRGVDQGLLCRDLVEALPTSRIQRVADVTREGKALLDA